EQTVVANRGCIFANSRGRQHNRLRDSDSQRRKVRRSPAVHAIATGTWEGRRIKHSNVNPFAHLLRSAPYWCVSASAAKQVDSQGLAQRPLLPEAVAGILNTRFITGATFHGPGAAFYSP